MEGGMEGERGRGREREGCEEAEEGREQRVKRERIRVERGE